MPVAATWKHLEIVILSEVSHTKDKYMTSLIRGILKKKGTKESIHKLMVTGVGDKLGGWD